MQITSALANALYGIKKGLGEMDKNAAKIAGADSFNAHNPTDLTQPLVELQGNRLQIAASAKVMTVVDETVGSLIVVVT